MKQTIESAKDDLTELQEIERVYRMTRIQIEPLIKRARMNKMIHDRYNDGEAG